MAAADLRPRSSPGAGASAPAPERFPRAHRRRRRAAVGRRIVAAPLAAAVPWVLAACATSSDPPPADEPTGPPPVVLEIGPTSELEEGRAAALVERAREALEASRFDDAQAAAATVVSELPRTRASGAALAIVARAAAGAERWEEAREASARLARVLPATDERLPRMILVEARALRALERQPEALGRILDMPVPAPPEVAEASRTLARELAGELPREVIGRILQATPLGQPLAAPVMVSYAATLLLAGEDDDARRFAQAALQAGATGEDADDARALLEGRVPGAAAPARIGALLPLSGSPALRAWAEGIREGIEVAVAAAGLGEVVQLDVLDSGGDASTSSALVRSAEGQGVVGLVGPLQNDAFAAAAMARSAGMPMLSPTAPELPSGADAVYSLGTVDPGAARSLAAWAADAGLRQVVVLHASRGPSAEEARVFAEAYQERGGSVLRTLSYEPGATYFEEQIRIVQGLRPEALVMPVPPADVVALAPQVSFFGLDTLGVQVLGTAGWTHEEILRDVSARHLDGVVATTAGLPASSGSPGFQRFVAAYESHFQRSIREAGVAALGYDAASLLLLALRSGARTPAAVRRALEDVRAFEGATGTISIEDGRIVREHHVICLWEGALRPLDAGARPEAVYRPHVADPETGIVPEGPGRRSGVRCPDVPVAGGR